MKKDIKTLIFSNDPIACDEIIKVLRNVKEIQKANIDEESLSAMNLLDFDFIMLHSDASKLLSEESFIEKIQIKADKEKMQINYFHLFHIPIIVLLDSKDSAYIEDISSLQEVSFCLTLDFSKDILIELFNDTVQMVTAIGRIRRKRMNKK